MRKGHVLDTKSKNQLLALVSFVFRDKILKQIHTVPDTTARDTHLQENTGIT